MSLIQDAWNVVSFILAFWATLIIGSIALAVLLLPLWILIAVMTWLID